ncbi:replication factor A1 [Halogranum amylolyticum]|uniref:Replication factor A1 n=1 Tax=Halogranum amylolyticum TaxID=660520 RepID=A0A1H8VZ60_9EURY|nr:single-stranded DNA binding protein [Halogranum amylolyticum]SEP20645.1 replication factor A1 [Halogranum amylolyticum]
MGAIEDVYEGLETEVSFEEFEAAVEEKVEQMGGLADDETAAMLIAHELTDQGGEVSGIADVEPGMDEVKFLAKVVSIGELRTFERDGEDEDGRVVNVEVADETGRLRVSFWDEMAADVVDSLEVGELLRVAGRPKDGFNGVEVSVDKAEPAPDEEVDVQLLDSYQVEDLSLGLSDVNLKGKILDTSEIRTFDRDDGSEGRVANLTVGDETGRVRVTLWDEQADRADELDADQTVEVVDGYVRERDGSLELHVGSRGAVEELEEEVQYVPDTADIGSLEIGQTVDIAGGVIETDPKRTFDRDDGSQGQVRNVRVKDETGEIRVALWGEKADTDVDLADHVVFTDVEIKDGWQDDLEASAGWRSTVSVTRDSVGDGGSDSTAATGRSEQGLDAFGESDDASEPGDDAETTTAESASTSGSGTAAAVATKADDANGETVEFTGTVVQAGSPVVLDNGTKTRSVRTDARLRLGEEITVRGTLRDGTIDADDVF